MAEENTNSFRPTASVVISSTSEHEGSENDHSNPISSSDDSVLSGNIASSSSNGEEQVTGDSVSQSHEIHNNQSCSFNDPAISSSCENNATTECESRSFMKAPALVLRPSALDSGFNQQQWKKNFGHVKTIADSSSSVKSPLRSPKLNLTATVSSAGTSACTDPVVLETKTADNKFFKIQNDENDSVSSSNVEGKSIPNNFGSLSVPNFVFGQNLHERVAVGDNSVKVVENVQQEPSCSNGNSEMLFTSVLNKGDASGKDIGNKETSLNLSNGRESTSSSSGLLEDAARYQEARSNKRKYEEVMITTGEEEENNILQVNVKLFAFDNGSWLERGRGTLRLNDKVDNGITTSRIVIRTLGSLRVVLNTKIWKGMSLIQASEKSIRLTALDTNGHLKVFLIQSSPKDMTTLYRCLESRLKKCTDTGDVENVAESPEKRIELSKTTSSIPVSNNTT